MTNRRMFFTMLWGAVFRRRSRAMMAVIASLVGAATLFCLASVCVAVPRQMNEEMREYGANLIVTPSAASGKSQGIDSATMRAVTSLVTAGHSAKSAAYRYESVRVNSAPYTIAGVDAKSVRALNRHWNVTGDWSSAGNVMVGRDVADALGVKVGSRVAIAYRSSDAQTSDSAESDKQSSKSDPRMSDSGESDTKSAQNGSQMSDSAESDAQSAEGTEGTDGTEDTEDTGTDAQGAGEADAASRSAETGTHATENGRVSSDIMDTDGTEFRVSGIVDTGGNEDSIIYATTADVAKLAGSKRGADVVEYSVNAMGDDLNAIVDGINRNPNSAVKAQTVTRITSSDTRIIAMLQTLFWIVSLVVLVLTLVGVGTTISSIVSQRRNEIGLRKALGASSRAIGAEFTVESAIYGLIGGLFGTAIGYVLARILCVTVFDRALGFNWLLGIASLMLSMLIAVIASIPPVRRATRIDPAIVLREE
ncbi:FtsX-like permease family protein [Bifidobacterium ruminantium]|uniref:ABC transporter permease n=1 Tax=Bifidobacterium ruminantium TaxID=78346 RepID=UPI00195990A1|nr:FtsX-like permease family protein [Bifidobacterium ruminantium]MBM6747088.1 FtsX-like permease family protein [Bifidobacterium ruminantium]